MKCLVIGGNRFVGLRVVHGLLQIPGVEVHVLNRTGQVAHAKNAVVYKGDRLRLESSFLDRDWDLIYDFACYNEADARASLSFFGQVGRYIFISTISVYDQAAAMTEDHFRPETFDLKLPMVSPPSYQDGKRRAEAVFLQQSHFPVLNVRFPVILGPDDYTNRLEFHLERVQRGEGIFIPNPAAKISMINSEDAAKFLLWARDQESVTGPLNVSSREPISLIGLMGQIELVTGIKPVLAPKDDDNESPYAPEKDYYMNTGKLESFGFKVRPIADWLPGLIGQPPRIKPRFVH